MRLYLILLWVFGIALIGGLSESTPAAQRYVAAAPVAVLLVACGLELISKTIVKFLPAFQRAALIVVILASILLAADDMRFYFMEYTPQSYYYGLYDFEGQGGVVTRHLANYLQTQSSAWQVVFVGYPILGFQTLPSMQFIAPHIQGVDLIKPWGDPQNPTFSNEKLIFVFTPNHDSDLAAAKQAYPGGKLFTETSELGQNVYAIYQVPPPSLTPEHVGPFYVFQSNLSIAWILMILCSLGGMWFSIFWLNHKIPLARAAQIAPRHNIFPLSFGKLFSKLHSEKENLPASDALKADQTQIPKAETRYQHAAIENESISTTKTIYVQINADIPADTIVHIDFQALDSNDKAAT